MNRALRRNSVAGSGYEDKIQAAASGLRKYTSTSDVVVRRGSSFGSLESMLGAESGHSASWWISHKDQFINSMASDSGFLSTSPAPSGGFDDIIEYRILVPKGSPAPYIANYSKFSSEQETLLPPGSQHRVIDLVEKEDGQGLIVYMELTGFSE